MGYDQFTVPDTVAVQPTLICYLPLALANIRPWPLAFSQISLKNSELKTTTIPFEIVACTFSDNLSRNSCSRTCPFVHQNNLDSSFGLKDRKLHTFPDTVTRTPL